MIGIGDMDLTLPEESYCWWCGAVANSREHRAKASQLRRMLRNADHLWFANSDRPTRINGARAKAVVFPKVMCKVCNNVRSQPFDEAYDHFVDFIWENPEYFRTRSNFDMLEIFDGDASGSANLARYYIKNIACRIAEAGFKVPHQIVDFMDGALGVLGGTLVLYKDFSGFDYFVEQGTQGHFLRANSMHNPASANQGPLGAFGAEIQDGPIGALFWWDEATPTGIVFSSRPLTYLRVRQELPYLDLHDYSELFG